MWPTSAGDVSSGYCGDVSRWCVASLPDNSVRPLRLGVNFRGPTAESGNQQVLYGLLDVAGTRRSMLRCNDDVIFTGSILLTTLIVHTFFLQIRCVAHTMVPGVNT